MVDILVVLNFVLLNVVFVLVPSVCFWIQFFKLRKFKKLLEGGFPDGWQFGKHT